MATRRTSARNFNNPLNRFNSANIAAIVGGRAPFSISYLAVAGGGAGGSNPFVIPATFAAGGGGGGGAGGYLEGVVTAQADTVYTIMVGAGGTGSIPAINTTQGSNSNISIDATSIAQALGGGFGLSYNSFPGYTAGASGGSGGGGQAPTIRLAGSGFKYPSPTQQGYPGGEANPNPGGGGIGSESQGGGGGAGGIGAAGSGSPAVSQGGPGGIGRQWPHTGATYYAGGGGGNSGYLSPGTGGSGGGGDGGYGQPPYGGTAGRTNSGGGGGGMGFTGSPQISGKNGGSGVVFLAIPTPAYRGVPSYTGSNVMVSTPPSSPGNTVIAFYTSGTFTA